MAIYHPQVIKNTLLIVSATILFFSLVILPVYLKPIPETQRINHNNGSSELFYKTDYLTFKWSMTIVHDDAMIENEFIYHTLYGKKIPLYILLPLLGMAALYTAIYASLFQLAFIFFKRLNANTKAEV